MNQLLKEEVSRIINKDFRTPEVLITVTRVDTSPDLNQSKIYVSVIPEEESDKALKGLRTQIYSLQQQVNKRLNMRPVPRIRFEKDQESRKAGRVEAIIEKLKRKN